MKYIKYIISIGALAIAIVRILRPDLEIDGVTLILIGLASIPRIGSAILSKQSETKSEIKYQNIDGLQDKAKKVGLLRTNHPTKKANKTNNTAQIGLFGEILEEKTIQKDESELLEERFFKDVFDTDRLLALAGTRFEIEKCIKQLSENFLNPDKGYNTQNALNLICDNGSITHEEKELIRDLIDILNKAIHAEVEYRNTKIIFDIGQNVIFYLKGKC